MEASIGFACLVGAVALGVFLAHHRGQNSLDAWAFARIPYWKHGQLPTTLVKLGSVPALVIGLGVVVFVSGTRDTVRTISCIVGPIVAVVIADEILKPLVARYIAIDESTYPSGTVTVIASVATALVLVTGSRWRVAIAVGSAITVVAVAFSVLVLRWHFLTDVVGGAAVGSGAVLLIDGLAMIAVPGPVPVPLDESDPEDGHSDSEPQVESDIDLRSDQRLDLDSG
jgi:membrane-associated phospholipid phosphatase